MIIKLSVVVLLLLLYMVVIQVGFYCVYISLCMIASCVSVSYNAWQQLEKSSFFTAGQDRATERNSDFHRITKNLSFGSDPVLQPPDTPATPLSKNKVLLIASQFPSH